MARFAKPAPKPKEPPAPPAPAPLVEAAAIRLSVDQKIEILDALSKVPGSAANLDGYRSELSEISDLELTAAQIVKKYAAIGRIDVKMGRTLNIDRLRTIAKGKNDIDVRIDVNAALAELEPMVVYRQMACSVLQKMLKVKLNTSQKTRVYLALARFGPRSDKSKRISNIRNSTGKKIESESGRIGCYLAAAEFKAGRKDKDPRSVLRNRMDALDRKRASGKQLSSEEITQEIRMLSYFAKNSRGAERTAYLYRLNEMRGMNGSILIGALVKASGIPLKQWSGAFKNTKIDQVNRIPLIEVLNNILYVGGERIEASRLLNGGTVSEPAQLQITFTNAGSTFRR